jgi:hypothetical protein
MLKYDKVYFLHIPKTGGRFFTKYILEPVEATLKENGIDVVKLPPNVSKHGGWHKDINENTYIISVFRDPVEFFVSAVAHMSADEKGLIDEVNDYIVKDKESILDIKKEFLYEKLEQLKYLTNFQSQNFLLTAIEGQLLQEARKAYSQNKVINKELAYERIKRVNLMIRHKDLKSMDYSILINKISKDLGIDIDIKLPAADREHYKNNSSEVLFNKLSKEDTDLIYNNFLFDKEIYENDLLFWKEK